MTTDKVSKEPMLEIYLFEATQLMEQLESISIECEKNKKINAEAINEIFRIMHTIKSSSAMMMFNDISILAHSLEDLFYYIRENRDASVDFESLFDLVLLGIDFIKGEVFKIENGNEADGLSEALVLKSSKLLKQMKAFNENKEIEGQKQTQETKFYISSYQRPNDKGSKKYFVKIYYDDGCEMENVRAYTVIYSLKDSVSELYYIPENVIDDNDSSEIIKKNGFQIGFSSVVDKEEIEKKLNKIIFLKSLEFEEVEDYPDDIKKLIDNKKVAIEEAKENTESSKEQGENIAKTSKHQSIISVNISKLDTLLDLVGEIVISEAMVTKNPDLNGLELENFNKASRQLRKLTNELQDIVMSIRMIPVSTTFQKMNRIVRDMSKKLDKEVELEIIGEYTEVDKNIIDHISDPLMHLVRNSIDHGIESKEERRVAGKLEKGKVTLEAKNAGGDVFIIVKDDGKGLNRSKIYEKAKLHGLVSKEEEEISDKEIFSYILLPGFSTNENVTEYSGRGVGMDVVKKNIDSIGGSILIDSIEGKGTTMTIKNPLTLAIIDGLEVAVGKAKYTIPIMAIRESFKAKENEVIADVDGNEMIIIRGEAYPIYRLHKIFNINTDVTSSTEGILIMVDNDSKSACLFVDSVIGEQQVVVKALPSYIKKAKGIAGCTILGDGSISIILDINEILER